MIALAVHDDGDGVPAKFQNDMWGRFERGLHKGNNSVSGSGIGLSVAKDLVIAHGGTIEYRTSEALGGACFEFTIPVPDQGGIALVSAGAELSADSSLNRGTWPPSRRPVG